MPSSRHSVSTPFRYACVAGITPASPWIGSSMIATVRESTAACSAARSLNGTLLKPGRPGSQRLHGSGSEADNAPRLRPWQAWLAVMM
ncbi:hypothetical protein D3C80_1976340 [compost metagenome]